MAQEWRPPGRWRQDPHYEAGTGGAMLFDIFGTLTLGEKLFVSIVVSECTIMDGLIRLRLVITSAPAIGLLQVLRANAIRASQTYLMRPMKWCSETFLRAT